MAASATGGVMKAMPTTSGSIRIFKKVRIKALSQVTTEDTRIETNKVKNINCTIVKSCVFKKSLRFQCFRDNLKMAVG